MNSVFMNGLVTGISSMLQQSEQVNGKNGQTQGLTSEQKQDFAEVLTQAIAKSMTTNSLYGGSLYGNALTGLYGSGIYGNSLYGGLYGSLYGGLYGNNLYGSLYGNNLYGNLYGNSLYGYQPYSTSSVMNSVFSSKSKSGSASSSGSTSLSGVDQMKQEQREQIESKLKNSVAVQAYQNHMSMMGSR